MIPPFPRSHRPRSGVRIVGAELALAIPLCLGLAGSCSATPPSETPVVAETVASPKPIVKADANNATPAEPEQSGPLQICTAMRGHDLQCASDLVQVLVDLRARHDAPAGFAAREKEDRGAVVEETSDELKREATEPRRTEGCEQLVEATPAQERQDRFAEIGACLSAPICVDYIKCMRPLVEARLVSGKPR